MVEKLTPYERVKRWRELNPEKHKAQRKVEYARNREVMIERSRAYREENRDKINAVKREEYAENAVLFKARVQRYREENKDRLNFKRRIKRRAFITVEREKRKKYYFKNRSRINEYQREYRKRVKQVSMQIVFSKEAVLKADADSIRNAIQDFVQCGGTIDKIPDQIHPQKNINRVGCKVNNNPVPIGFMEI